MSSPSAAPRGIRSSCLTHSDRTTSCCPHSAGCSWTSAPCLQKDEIHIEWITGLSVRIVHVTEYTCFHVDSPASTSQRVKRPMRTSPFTVHFWVSQFGLQLWFMNREEFPFGPASITRSYEGHLDTFDNIITLKTNKKKSLNKILNLNKKIHRIMIELEVKFVPLCAANCFLTTVIRLFLKG